MNTNALSDVMKAYDSFNDSVIEQFSVCFDYGPKIPSGVVVLPAQQIGVDGDNEWYRVKLLIEGVDEFRLTHGNNEYCLVLSSGLQIVLLDGRLFFVFDEHKVVDTIEKARTCPFYIAGKSCSSIESRYLKE